MGRKASQQAVANAHLIAAAPDLLAACKAAMAAVIYAETMCKDGSDWKKDQILAAIWKATGQ